MSVCLHTFGIDPWISPLRTSSEVLPKVLLSVESTVEGREGPLPTTLLVVGGVVVEEDEEEVELDEEAIVFTLAAQKKNVQIM